MGGFFKKMGLGKGGDKKPRSLDHPRDLHVRDIVKFGFAAQPEISNTSLTVRKILTLDLGGDTNKRTYFILSDVDKEVRMRVIDDDTVELALEVLPETLFQAFKKSAIAAALDAEASDHNVIKARKPEKIPEALQHWIGETYRQEGYLQAYRYEGDYRDKALPTTIASGEIGCDYAYFVTDDRKHALEFRIFDGGRTEAHLCVILPLRKIEELWPAGAESNE